MSDFGPSARFAAPLRRNRLPGGGGL